MTAKLYVVPASHPCATVAAALDLKGLPYRRVELAPAFHKLHQKLRFGGRGTVPRPNRTCWWSLWKAGTSSMRR